MTCPTPIPAGPFRRVAGAPGDPDHLVETVRGAAGVRAVSVLMLWLYGLHVVVIGYRLALVLNRSS